MKLRARAAIWSVFAFIMISAAGYLLDWIFDNNRSEINRKYYEFSNRDGIILYKSSAKLFGSADDISQKDPIRAARLYQESLSGLAAAAESGVYEAMAFYGSILCYGRIDFFPTNRPLGLYYLEKAKRGESVAEIIYGECPLAP